MPTYSYACTACEHRFDIYQEFSDDALTSCPECAGRLRKLFGSVGVTFKGSGFYLNDHGKASGSKTDAKSNSNSDSATKPADKASKPAETSKTSASSSAQAS